MSEQNNEAIVGPSARFSEHKVGDVIRFSQDGGLEKSGEIIYVRAPAPISAGGEPVPMIYLVACGDGFPDVVFPHEVIEEEEPGGSTSEIV